MTASIFNAAPGDFAETALMPGDPLRAKYIAQTYLTDARQVTDVRNMLGFTGTPIFADNADSHGNPRRRTTEQAFGDKLHAYTIVDAINDKNVLPFRIDYINKEGRQ